MWHRQLKGHIGFYRDRVPVAERELENGFKDLAPVILEAGESKICSAVREAGSREEPMSQAQNKSADGIPSALRDLTSLRGLN